MKNEFVNRGDALVTVTGVIVSWFQQRKNKKSAAEPRFIRGRQVSFSGEIGIKQSLFVGVQNPPLL